MPRDPTNVVGGRCAKDLQQCGRGVARDTSLRQLSRYAVRTDLVQLVERDKRVSVVQRRDSRHAEQRSQQLPMIQSDDEVIEAKLDQRVRHGRAQLRFHHRRRRPKRVDVALIELAEPSTRGAIGAPYRLNLIAFEHSRQLALMLRDDAGERNREVVAKRQIGLTAGLVLAALEDLEDELVALFAVLPEQRLDVLDCGGLERLESVPLVDALDNRDDILAAPHVLRQEVAHAARRLGACHIS